MKNEENVFVKYIVQKNFENRSIHLLKYFKDKKTTGFCGFLASQPENRLKLQQNTEKCIRFSNFFC